MRALSLQDRQGENEVRKCRKKRINRPDPVILERLSASVSYASFPGNLQFKVSS